LRSGGDGYRLARRINLNVAAMAASAASAASPAASIFIMICAASFAPVDSSGVCGQADVACVAQFNPAVSFQALHAAILADLARQLFDVAVDFVHRHAHWLSWRRLSIGDSDRIARLGHDRRAGGVCQRDRAVLIGDLRAIGAVRDGDSAATDADSHRRRVDRDGALMP